MKSTVRPFSIFISLIIAIALGGCASVDEQTCRSGNWYEIGYHDGAAGLSYLLYEDLYFFHSYTKSCAKYGLAPDDIAFQSGYSKGIESFCQPKKSFNLGLEGQAYNGYRCPSEFEAAYRQAYDDGKSVRDADSRVASAEAAVNNAENLLKTENDNIAGAEAALVAPETKAPERDEAVSRIKAHPFVVRKLQRDLRELRQNLTNARKERDQIRARIMPRY